MVLICLAGWLWFINYVPVALFFLCLLSLKFMKGAGRPKQWKNWSSHIIFMWATIFWGISLIYFNKSLKGMHLAELSFFDFIGRSIVGKVLGNIFLQSEYLSIESQFWNVHHDHDLWQLPMTMNSNGLFLDHELDPKLGVDDKLCWHWSPDFRFAWCRSKT